MAAFTAEEMEQFKMANWYDLSGQVAIVTGGSTGLGLAITRCLVSAGAKVCVVSFETPEQAAEALSEFGDKAEFTSLISQTPPMHRSWWTGSWQSRAAWIF